MTTQLLKSEWDKLCEGTIGDEPNDVKSEAEFFFYAGANTMYALIMRAPETDVEKLVFFNDLQRELLDFIKDDRKIAKGIRV